MSFPAPFLTELAREKQLTERETEVFLALFGEGKNRLEITEHLHLQESAVNTCLTGVYKKFGISESGPVKESRLKDELRRRERIWQNQRVDRPSPSAQSVSDQTKLSADNSGDHHSLPSQDQDDLIQRVREHCRQKILDQHSWMRLLSGEEIGVDQLYVDVWLLNRSPRTYQVSQSKLLETFDLRNDRLGLGDRIKRNPGFEIANANPKILILGKPGLGKTTFLKHLAVDWCKGQFQSDLIAVFIEFRRIRDEQWYLLDAIGKELGLDEGHQIRGLKEQIEELKKKSLKPEEKQIKQRLNALPLQVFLTEGKLLILMDGLDEVPTNDLRRDVQKQLRAIAEEYSQNRFALTCRTQIMTSLPVGFTSVEVADFNSEQVQQFVLNWFVANGNPEAFATEQWETIRTAANNSPALNELTVTPVLLSLMCVVLQDEGKIPLDRDWLYKKGIKLLLSRWNEEKQIDSWEVGDKIYRQLSIEEKEALLTAIAARKFENPKNFVLFEQDEIADQIKQLLHLANRQEGVAVLKAIEAQHGLLIERADELWSFSHLTFQEYFTVQWLTQLPSEQLAEKIAKQQWQEVVKQLVKSQQPADRLLRLIKQVIDRSVSNESKINQFLTWVWQKAESIQSTYKPAAIRALYFALAHAHNLARPHARTRDRALALALARDNARDLALDLDLTRALDRAFARALDLDPTLDLDLDLASALARAYARDLARDLDLGGALARDHALDLDLNRAHARDLARAYANCSDSELKIKLEEAYQKLPNFDGNFDAATRWWQTEGTQWVEQLSQVMIDHRNIGHNWRFTEAQKQQLQSYYDANKFLVDLINIEGAVSDSVRAEIEDTLLLPWDELQRRQPGVYE